ncbi:g1182 [Coccomyxa viridis]|uniref:G1182 protein n=1 Tax=Coccomyxa viridis TaxID=1274662 RepID=A0ABP1FHF6_9CHLO
MSGLFKPPAQESVFTLGDEDIADTDVVNLTSYNKALPKAVVPQPAPHKDVEGAALPVSSVAGATQGPLNGSSAMPPVDEVTLSSQKGANVPQQAHQSDPASGDVGSEAQKGSEQPVNGTLTTQAVASDAGRHLDEDEEQRIAEELAALEVEAEEQVLQEQQRRSAALPQGAGAHARNGDSISLSDGTSAAERDMAEAEQVAQQASAGTTAMQTALDGFEPRKRPFSPPPGSAPLQRLSPTAEYIEPPEFRGLLFFDGLDSLGRPVVIVNADAMGENKGARKNAFQHIVQVLEPIVVQGPYVLLLVSLGGGTKSNTIQTGLLVSAYRGLSRPFRKNVKFIILVRPSKPLKALLAFLKPFVSRKAHRKVLKIESLATVAYATNNEVTLASLGPRFTAAAGDFLQ